MIISCVMVDLETMDLEVTAAITSIGAYHFDLTGSRPETSFEKHITLESNQKEGRSINAETIIWWLQQSKKAQDTWLNAEKCNLPSALMAFTRWCSELRPRPQQIWAKDPDFDCNILTHAGKQHRILWPFKFWQSRSLRTLVSLAWGDDNDNVPNFEKSLDHSALADAQSQVLLAQAAYKELLS